MKIFGPSHYDWLEENFITFLTNINFPDAKYCGGMIVAHGDKGYQYKKYWEDNNIPFEHGMALFLLTYISPWSKEVRQTSKGWVKADQWVVENYAKFKQFLPPAYQKRVYE